MRKKDETAETVQGLPPEEKIGVGQGQAPGTSAEQDGEGNQSPVPPAPPEPPKTVRVEFLTNVKHNRELFQAGQRCEVPEAVYLELQAAKAVRQLGE
jgi:hypothetical protein